MILVMLLAVIAKPSSILRMAAGNLAPDSIFYRALASGINRKVS